MHTCKREENHAKKSLAKKKSKNESIKKKIKKLKTTGLLNDFSAPILVLIKFQIEIGLNIKKG